MEWKLRKYWQCGHLCLFILVQLFRFLCIRMYLYQSVYVCVFVCRCINVLFSLYLVLESVHVSSCDFLSVCLSIYLYLSICLSVCLSIYLSIYLWSIYLSIYLPIYLSIYMSNYMSVCLSVYLSVCLSNYLSVCLSVNASFYLYVCLCLSSLVISVYQKLSSLCPPNWVTS